mgnify:CR=1 FL=1
MSCNTKLKYFIEKRNEYASVEKALSDEVRMKILERLLVAPASITDLSREFNLSKPLVYYHLKILRKAALVRIVGLGHGRRGTRKKYYGLTISGQQIMKSVIKAHKGKYKSVPLVLFGLIINNDPYFYTKYKKALKLAVLPYVPLLIFYVYRYGHKLLIPNEVLLFYVAMSFLLTISLVNITFILLSRWEMLKRKYIYNI